MEQKIGLVQPQGKRPMPAADWARGVNVASASPVTLGN